MKRRFGFALVVLAVVFAAACGSSSKASSGSSGTTAASPTTAYGGTTAPTSAATSSPTVLKTATNPTLHVPIIVDANGKTVYMYKPDGTSTTSKVPAALKAVWPAATSTSGDKGVGAGLSAGKVSLNSDHQLAYNGHLLYTFSADTKPGDARGQGLGKVWYVLSPDGAPIT